jgi:regulator of protease activity HflC (stomatin/prohibitin superfamily)
MSRWDTLRERLTGRRPAAPDEPNPDTPAAPPVQSVVELGWERLVFGSRVSLLVIVFVCLFWFENVFIFVDSGQAGVRWKRFGGGTEAHTYDEGVHIIWPWDKMYLYQVRVQTLPTKSTIYTQDGLEVRVEANVRFHPAYNTLHKLHRDVGPDYVEKLVKPEIESTLRKVLGNFTPLDIYSKDEEGLIEELQTTLAADFDPEYVILDKFLIEELRLPDEVQRAIQEKLTEEQRVQAYYFILDKEEAEHKRRIIEATGIRDFEEISGLPILRWRGLEVTEKLATSANAKVVLIGTGADQLPLILNTDSGPASLPRAPEPSPSVSPISPSAPDLSQSPLTPAGGEGAE